MTRLSHDDRNMNMNIVLVLLKLVGGLPTPRAIRHTSFSIKGRIFRTGRPKNFTFDRLHGLSMKTLSSTCAMISKVKDQGRDVTSSHSQYN